jgi:hypothetical protein
MADNQQTNGGCGSAIDESIQRVIDAGDVAELRRALTHEASERRRQECLANIQTEITRYTLELLVREADLDAFFRALLKTLAEEAESQIAGVWLLNEDDQCCEFWMAHFGGKVVTTGNLAEFSVERKAAAQAQHLFDYKPGWVSTIEYRSDDPRIPEAVREFNAQHARFDRRLLVADRARRGDRDARRTRAAQEPHLRAEATGGTPQSDPRGAQSPCPRYS